MSVAIRLGDVRDPRRRLHSPVSSNSIWVHPKWADRLPRLESIYWRAKQKQRAIWPRVQHAARLIHEAGGLAHAPSFSWKGVWKASGWRAVEVERLPVGYSYSYGTCATPGSLVQPIQGLRFAQAEFYWLSCLQRMSRVAIALEHFIQTATPVPLLAGRIVRVDLNERPYFYMTHQNDGGGRYLVRLTWPSDDALVVTP